MTPENYRLDGEARALYWGEYRKTFETLRGLKPGYLLPPETHISIMGNKSLRPTSFDLRKVDREPMTSLPFPGKSAHIAFTQDIIMAYNAVFDRAPRRTEAMYLASSGKLQRLGFFAFYAPLPNAPLHVRVVHAAHIINPSRLDTPFRARELLVRLLIQGDTKLNPNALGLQ